MEIYYSKLFLKNYKKLPNQVKIKFEKQEKVFQTNPFDPKLKTHPLTGLLRGKYSFSVDYHYRVVFKFESENEVWFLSIGTHAIYK